MTEQMAQEPDEVTGTDDAAPPDRDWEAEARELGWKPEAEFDGKGEFRSAEDFVRRGEEILPIVKSRLDKSEADRVREKQEFDQRIQRLEAANKAAMEAQRNRFEQEKKDVETRMRSAAAEGDLETYDTLSRQRDDMKPPEQPEPQQQQQQGDPTVERWSRENPWFLEDGPMRALAIEAAGKAAESGADVNAQIQAAEAEVKRRFPEKFGTPPATVEGQRRAPPKKRNRGASDLPKEAREAFDRFVRQGVYKDADIGKYAASYWGQE